MGLLNTLFGKGPDLKAAIAEGATIVDVRSPGEFSGGHVKGSINIPLDQVEKNLSKFKSMKGQVILCCASGNRSGSATRYLQSQGIDCINGGSWLSVNGQV